MSLILVYFRDISDATILVRVKLGNSLNHKHSNIVNACEAQYYDVPVGHEECHVTCSHYFYLGRVWWVHMLEGRSMWTITLYGECGILTVNLQSSGLQRSVKRRLTPMAGLGDCPSHPYQ